MSTKIHGVTSKNTVILILEITCFTKTSSFDVGKYVYYGKECLSENEVEFSEIIGITTYSWGQSQM